MEETFARTLQFIVAGLAAFGVALWFALAVWAFRDISRRSSSIMVQVLATLLVVLGSIPGIVIYLLLRPRETEDERYQREIEENYLAQELSASPICPRCARIVRDEFTFCPDCGTVLRRSCASCGRLADIDWAICAFCGYDLTPRGRAAANGRVSAPVAPERVVTTDDWEVDLDSESSEDAPVVPPRAAGQKSSTATSTEDYR